MHQQIYKTMNNLSNTVQLIGFLGEAPKTTTFENGNAVCNFTIATNEKYKNKEGELITDTEWHRISAWGKQAETCQKYLKKGSRLAVNGKLTTRNYDDKDGNKRFITEIRMREMVMLDSKES